MTDLLVDWCDRDATKYAVEYWHYSRRTPRGRLAMLGVWEDSAFQGVIVFGRGNSATMNTRMKRLFGLEITEHCELVRVALKRGHQTPVTKLIRLAIQKLRQSSPSLRLIVSFADPNQGHLGKIYQAGNWVYTGHGTPVRFFKGPSGKRMHQRTVSKSGRVQQFERVQRVLSTDDCKVFKEHGRYRYLMPLDKQMRRLVEKHRQPYPGRLPDGGVGVSSADGGSIPAQPLQN